MVDVTGTTSPDSTHAEETLGLAPGSFPFHSRFLDMGARIHYIDEGTGPALLMIHGNPTWSFVFRHLILLLCDSFRCVALDLPGFGLSERPPDYGFLPEEQVRVVAGFVEGLGLRSFTPMVQDWGGPIGLYVAGFAPERIERLVIGNTWCWTMNGDFHCEMFSRTPGGPLGRLAIRRFNAFVNGFVPAGIKRKPITEQLIDAYRKPFVTDGATPYAELRVSAEHSEVSDFPCSVLGLARRTEGQTGVDPLGRRRYRVPLQRTRAFRSDVDAPSHDRAPRSGSLYLGGRSRGDRGCPERLVDFRAVTSQ